MSHAGEILLVDDTPENLRVLGDLLSSHGLTVRVASSGAMALRSVQARHPDLILLDIRMPEMDGFETCRRLRQDAGLIGIPVLFLSASDAPADRIEAFRVGGEDFISKPFQAEEVLARVTTHLALARTRRDLDLANDRLAEQVMTEGVLRGHAESVAAERLARLELVLAAANMGAWEVAPDSAAMTFDARARALLGIAPGQHPTWRAFLRLLPEVEREGVTLRWERARQAQETYDVEGWWTVPASGADEAASRKRIRLRGRPLPAKDGEAARMVGVIWDVTEEFQLRQRLTQGERLEALGLLAGGVAHDFNNQLAVILGEVEILHLGDAVTPQIRPHLEHIASAAESSTALIRDLLAFARRRDLERAPIDLGAVVAQAARLAARSLGSSIRFETALPAQPIWVSGNAGQLENAILNLCINARDAMPEGGALALRLEQREVAAAVCQTSHATFGGSFAVISVADNGSGIPDDIRGRIFEPFFTTKPEGKGNGIGLAAVLGCIASHDGHLTLATTPGHGTTFAIHLAPIPAPEPAAPSAATVASRRCGRLLVLDDQATVREVIADGLRRFGWEVVVFADPAAAIAAWQEATPAFDLALVDLVMPQLGGAAVFRALRRQDPRARVVLMSGHTAGENLALLAQEGLAGFVDKPVRLRQLAQLLGGILEGGPA